MFDEVESESWFLSPFLSWAAQLFLAFCGPFTLWVILAGSWNLPDTAALDYVEFAIMGAGLAALVSAAFRDATRVGSLVWALPAAVATAGLAWDGWLSGIGTVADYFQDPGPGRGEEAWGFLPSLLTLPTWGCCWYSAFMWWRLRGRRHAPPGAPQGVSSRT